MTIADAQHQSTLSDDVLKLMLPCPGAKASANAFVRVLNAQFTQAQLNMISRAFVLAEPSVKELVQIVGTTHDRATLELILGPVPPVTLTGQSFLDVNTDGLTRDALSLLSQHIRVVAAESFLVSFLKKPLNENDLFLLGQTLEPVTIKTKEGIFALARVRDRGYLIGRAFINDDDLVAIALRVGFTIAELKPFIGVKPLHPASILAAFKRNGLSSNVAVDFLLANSDGVILEPSDVDALSKSTLTREEVSRVLSETNHSGLQLDPAIVANLKLRGVPDEVILRLTKKQNGVIPMFSVTSSDRVYRIGGDVTAPILINKVEPSYSEEAQKAKYSGTVLLSIVVDANGLPGDIHIIRPLGLGLDEKAIEAVRKWRSTLARRMAIRLPLRPKWK